MTCADQFKACRLLNAFIASLRARPEDRDEVLGQHVAYMGGPGTSTIDVAKLKLLAQAALPGGAGFKALVVFREVANPAAVLALIERMERAEVDVESLRKRVQGAQEEAYGALDAARAANEEAGLRSSEIESLKKRAELAESRKEHTESWYAVRLERLKDMAKERGFWPEMAAIIANGTAGNEPPTYALQLNLAIGRAESAKKTNAALLERMKKAEASEAALLDRVEFKEGELVASRTKAFEEMQALNKRIEALASAALLAFLYIDDRSAGSSEAWDSLARALGMDPGESGVSELVTALRALAAEPEGR
ncbi:hypothetical protein [Myxococcus sp. Y35]|uniref:hypothetical protein n=1 Tax=Pseudomyxococcus flavus TaxID=3115648 RepID=UPI003CEB27C6